MDFATGLKTEVFRPSVTLLIPGIVAASPFPFVTVQYHPELLEFAVSHSTLAAVLGFLVSIGFGLLVQELGSAFEALVIDKRLSLTNPHHMDEWYLYLRCTLPQDLIGRGYIHDLVLFLKFELNFTSALLVCWFGLLWLFSLRPIFAAFHFAAITAGFLIVGGLFAYVSFKTAAVLGRVRKELLKGVGCPPLSASQSTASNPNKAIPSQ